MGTTNVLHHQEVQRTDKTRGDLIGCLARGRRDANSTCVPMESGRAVLRANTTTVKESAWDLSLFLFCELPDVMTIIMVFLCVSFNTSLQASFIYVVAGFIASSNENLGDLAADLAHWCDGASASVQALVCDSNFAWRSDFSSSWTRASLTTSAPRPMQG